MKLLDKNDLTPIWKAIYKIEHQKHIMHYYGFKHREEINQRQRIKNRTEDFKKYQMEWNKTHKKRKETHTIYNIAYRKKHLDELNEYDKKRYPLRKEKQIIENKIRKYAYYQMPIDDKDASCIYCGRKEHLSIEHIIPRKSYGDDVPDNMGFACESCNYSKVNLHPLLFCMKKGYPVQLKVWKAIYRFPFLIKELRKWS